LPIYRGFLLHRFAYDNGQSTRIELWVSTALGPCQLYIDGQWPVFFIQNRQVQKAKALVHSFALPIRFKSLDIKTFDQKPVVGCYAPTLRASRRFSHLLKEHGVVIFEEDIPLAERYLMERFIKGSLEFTGESDTVSHQKNHRVFHQVRCRQGEYQPKLRSICMAVKSNLTMLSVGLSCAGQTLSLSANYSADVAMAEREKKKLLYEVMTFIQEKDPDVILGWGIHQDLITLLELAESMGVSLKLGRHHKKIRLDRSNGKFQHDTIVIAGRVVLDTAAQMKMATYHFENWSLSNVVNALFGQVKEELTQPSHQAQHYCHWVNAIVEKTHLLEFCVSRSQLTGLTLGRLGGSVAAFDFLYLPKLHRAGYVAPKRDVNHWKPSPGGFVMSSEPGLYDSVLVLDFKSLYPAIIRTFCIDPLGLVEGLKQVQDGPQDLGTSSIPGFLGGCFHREKHFLPQMIQALWQARDEAKRKGRKAFSTAIKIIMNSFYGVLGSSGCRFFDNRLAASITCRGHEIMKKTRQLIEALGYRVIYGDTDSLFVSLEKKASEHEAANEADDICHYVNQWWKDHLQETFGLTSELELEHETHYKRFFLPTLRGVEQGSKKRYAGLITHHDRPEVVFKGLENVRSDWTLLARNFQRQLYEMIFLDQDPGDFIRKTLVETTQGNNDALLYYRKRIRRPLDSYTKSTPPQVKAARWVESIRQQNNQSPMYDQGGVIEYMMTVGGPQAKGYVRSAPDYSHYFSRQLQSVADAILPIIDRKFSDYV